MVNNRPPSQSTGSSRQGAVRVISGGPLFALDEVKALLGSGGATIWLANQSCIDDVADLEWDSSHVCDLICSLVGNEFRHSEECTTDSNAVLNCDVYVARRREQPVWSTQLLDVTYYVKFSLRKLSKNYVAVISCHLERHKI